jgi:hypothetical protein
MGACLYPGGAGWFERGDFSCDLHPLSFQASNHNLGLLSGCGLHLSATID